jgi:vesicle-fusing ATPase
MRLKTKPIPEGYNHLQYTPYVYINSEQFREIDNNYIGVDIDENIFILNIKPLETIEKGFIHMNSLNRKTLNITLDSTYDYTLFHSKIDPIDTINIMIECNNSMNNSMNNSININIEDITTYIKTNYKDLVVRINDIIPIKYNDTLLKLCIKSYELFTMVGMEDHGLITNLTIFEFDKNKPNITFTNDSSQKQIFHKSFDFKQLDIGGLNDELTTIFRKVFVSRLLSQNVIEKLEIKHIKGLILHGPPGTGKTLIARQLSKSLQAKSIKIINGPELVSSFVGKSEENVRKLFEEAENDMKSNTSGLHIIVFDEFDSLCKRRGEIGGISGDVNDKIVTQLLSKIDGVECLNNILLIGMTNRLELIDNAILRPGRFEVHVEITLPNEEGRNEILSIHTRKLKENKCLDEDVDINILANKTKNYTGAELEGLVRDARSYAINTMISMDNLGKKINMEDININMGHFEKAISNYIPKFGKSEHDLDYYIENKYNTINIDEYDTLVDKSLLVIVIDGDTQTYKTSKSVLLAQKINYPYIKVISNNDMIGYSENSKTQYIKDIFNEAYSSSQSVIVIDNMDTIVEYYNNNGTMRMMFSLYNSLKTLLSKKPTKANHKLIIIINADEIDIPIKSTVQ